MSQQESSAPRQATRLVTATRRQEMAQELARILGRKRSLPSALEVAAAQWEKEARTKEAGEGKPRSSQAIERYPFSLQRVSLQVENAPPADDPGWSSYLPPRKAKPPVRRRGGIPVGSFATRMIQRERAGGSRVVLDPRARALEEAARRWKEQRKASNPRR